MHTTIRCIAPQEKLLLEVIYGKVIVPPILRTKDEIFAADEYVRDLETTFSQVRTAIERSQLKQKQVADKHRRQLDLKIRVGTY